MKCFNRSWTALMLLAALAVGLPFAPAALAAAPSNDNFANARVVDSFPFTDTVNMAEATAEPGEPFPFPGGFDQTVWYRLTPTAAGVYRTSLNGSISNSGFLGVYRQSGTGFGGLSFVNGAGLSGDLFLTADAGATYYFQANTISSASGILQFNLTAVASPSNDNFASAAVIATLPYSNNVDTTAATLEPNEPSLCTPPPAEKTVWYTFTPATAITVSASASAFFAPVGIAIYTGSSPANLTQVACAFAQPVTARLGAGTTYYFQIGSLGQSGGPIQFNVAVPPPPQVGLFFFPNDPSTFDTVQFINQSFDPAGAAFTSFWTFGDGTTSSDQSPRHQYAADGQYSVKLAVTTSDGRTASATQVVRVATHDVSITSFDTPQSVKVGKAREITVGISNGRYQERVQVQLFKSNNSGGFDLVGTLVQTVPVQSGKHETTFTFSNVFTDQDAAVGKVTLMANATLLDARDALPFDNQAISLPILVRR